MSQHLASDPLSHRLLPFLRWWPMVTRDTLRADLIAGLTGAVIVLPQGVAFATIAGLPPEYGLYAALAPAIIAALFGSSWHLVSGPTTAISIALFAALSPLAVPGSPEYIRLALTLTFLVGVFQLVLGLARLGVLVNFISHTVVLGFTSGAALLIASSQIRNFSGLAIPRGTPFHESLAHLVRHAGEINPWIFGVASFTLAVGIAVRRLLPKWPHMIVAMLAGSALALLLDAWQGVEVTRIATVGALPARLPPLSTPDLSLETLRQAFVPALVVSMLALTEAVSIARSIALKSGQRIDGNQEFIGQGLSNLFGSLCSGYASSGSFNRSGVNYAAGARTPLATVCAALFLALIMLLVAPFAAYLPLAVMAGILLLVAWGLLDLHHLWRTMKTSRSESLVLWVTMVGVLVNLEFGLFAGVLLSLAFYLRRVSHPAIDPVVPSPEPGAYHFIDAAGRPECPQICMLRINGSLFFGAVDHVQQRLLQVDAEQPGRKSLMIVASGMNFVDLAGASLLAQEARRRRALGGGLYFYRCKDRVGSFLRKAAVLDEIGQKAFFTVQTDWVPTVYATLDPEICRGCKSRIFEECLTHLPDGRPRSDERALFLGAGV